MTNPYHSPEATSPGTLAAVDVPARERGGPAWEHPEPLLRRYWQTLRLAYRQPGKFFSTMNREGEYHSPIDC